ncbi:Pib2p Ecym_1434 [Eremothecium cymbalariae DBVPG|uniref:FYVE-type domain-containing protein n=1 Tax=Eremothecium cymbalariae (strain CBS 270.75 / DBVPG 7215 / KCTC 17166 / NRRL Y-17582) TaxID=931890 RepID=G8JM90_ERECY|nr:hypothetical protein Ecym_1434 [Eremothecium cymbalariae DBVPG\
MGSVHSQNSDMETEAKQSGTPARRYNSDTSVVSNKSTITFEKRKVPLRGRTHSLQSVFSGMSLKSMLQNSGNGGNGAAGAGAGVNGGIENGDNGTERHNNSGGGGYDGMGRNHNGGSAAGPALTLVTNFVNAAQQIQSPAIASSNMLRRRTTRSSMASGRNVIEEDLEDDIKIGERLPFTDEQRMITGNQLQGGSSDVVGGGGSEGGGEGGGRVGSNQSNSLATTVSSAAPEHSSTTPQKLGDTPISGHSSDTQGQTQQQKLVQQRSVDGKNSGAVSGADVDEEDEFTQQKQLTRDALRKLSMLQANKVPLSVSGTLQNDQDGTIDPDENLNEPQEPLTHLQFGGKHVILETSRNNPIPLNHSQVSSANGLRRSSIGDVLSQPEPLKLPGAIQGNYNVSTNYSTHTQDSGLNGSAQQEQHFAKKPIRQINEPKKPMYMPAVLRDISETNLNWNQLKSHSPSSHRSASGQPINNLKTNKGGHSNYASSTHSATSSFLTEYRRKFDIWLACSMKGDYSAHNSVNLVPPTRKHWVADSKRQSCKYCHKLFTFWERKHHCRHCGDIFCQQHVRHWMYLNPNAKFIIGGGGIGMLSKICDGCLEEYERLVREGPNAGNAGSGAARNGNTYDPLDRIATSDHSKTISSKVPVASIDTTLEGDDKAADASGRQRLDSFVGSVPADWSWSSF